jgi:hypothetical protein
MASALPHHHAVQFYGDDERLFSTVAGFLAEGLITGEPALVIATKSHRTGILAQLAARLVNVDRARQNGDLVLIDAQEMLDLFMIDKVPDPKLFETNVERFLEQTLLGRPGTVLRAYGEMVDVLWKQGDADAAIKLEILWNKLATRFGFALLCGYAMGSFFKKAERLQEVVAQHTHVLDDRPHFRHTPSTRGVH